MRWALILGLVCGCNQVFGINTTDLIDAPPDSPPDAPPPTCPATGELPKFGNDLTMVSARYCQFFAVNEAQTSAAALCLPANQYPYKLSTGTVEEGVTEQMMMPEPTGILAMRLAPEGDAMLVVAPDAPGSYTNTVYPYVLANGMWTASGKSFSPPTDQPGWFTISNPSRGPTRRLLATVVDSSYVNHVVELEWDGTRWNEVHRVLTAELVTDYGGTDVNDMSLSADGLRLVFTTVSNRLQPQGYAAGYNGYSPTIYQQGPVPVLYADRASLAVPFSKPRVLESVPGQVSFPHLAENCGRIYFSALDTVWFLRAPNG